MHMDPMVDTKVLYIHSACTYLMPAVLYRPPL